MWKTLPGICSSADFIWSWVPLIDIEENRIIILTLPLHMLCYSHWSVPSLIYMKHFTVLILMAVCLQRQTCDHLQCHRHYGKIIQKRFQHDRDLFPMWKCFNDDHKLLSYYTNRSSSHVTESVNSPSSCHLRATQLQPMKKKLQLQL
jgi:hypothetical protein